MAVTSFFTAAAALVKYQANNNVSPMNIRDTGKNIAAKFDQLAAISKKIIHIKASSPLTISYAHYVKDKVIVSKITTTSTVTITGVTKANIENVLKKARYIDKVVITSSVNSIDSTKTSINSAIVKAGSTIKIVGFVIKDTFLNVSTHIEQLNSLGAKLNNIILSDANPNLILSVTAGQFVNDQKVIGLIVNQGPKLSVSDTANNLANNIDNLSTNANKITGGIFITDALNPISITANQLNNDTAALNLIQSAYTLGVTQAPVNFVAPTAYASKITSISVTDTSANITQNFNALSGLGIKLTSIYVSDAVNPLLLSFSQLTNNSTANLLNEIQSTYSLSISNATVANLTNITDNTIVKFAVNADFYLADSSVNIFNNIASLTAINNANLINIKAISFTELSAPNLSLTSVQYLGNADILNLINSPYSLTVSGVLADDLLTVLQNPHVTNIIINDTADNISTAFDSLNTNSLRISAINVNSIDPKTPISLLASQFLTDNAALGLLKGNYTLDITNALANFNSQSNASTYASHIASVSVVDSTANIISNLDSLNSLGAKLIDITPISPINTPLEITAAQFTADFGVLNKVLTNFSVNINNVLAGNVNSIINHTDILFNINGLSVSDTSANIIANLDNLETNITALNAIIVNDNKFSMAITLDQLTNDIDVLNFMSKANPAFTYNVNIPVSTPIDVNGANGHINFILHPNSTGTPTDINFGSITQFTGQDKISFDAPSTKVLIVKGSTAPAVTGLAHIDSTSGLATFSQSDSTLGVQINAVENALSQAGTTLGNVAFWEKGLNSYVFISDATPGVTAGDNLIQLIGVDVSHLHLVNGAITYS